MVVAHSVQRQTGGAACRGCTFLIVLLCHAALVGMILRMMAKQTAEAPAEVVSFLSLSAQPAAPLPSAPAVQWAVPDLEVEGPTIVLPTSIPYLSRKRARAALAAAPTFRADPCAEPSNPGANWHPDPSCSPPLHLDLPGGFHQDGRGQIVPNESSLFAHLPPESPDQIRAEEERHTAALERLFGPPPKPLVPLFDENPARDAGVVIVHW